MIFTLQLEVKVTCGHKSENILVQTVQSLKTEIVPSFVELYICTVYEINLSTDRVCAEKIELFDCRVLTFSTVRFNEGGELRANQPDLEYLDKPHDRDCRQRLDKL